MIMGFLDTMSAEKIHALNVARFKKAYKERLAIKNDDAVPRRSVIADRLLPEPDDVSLTSLVKQTGRSRYFFRDRIADGRLPSHIEDGKLYVDKKAAMIAVKNAEERDARKHKEDL
jgi:hypothetical protein